VDLVYGGGSLGLMGQVSEAVHKGGGHVIGSVPSLSLASCPLIHRLLLLVPLTNDRCFVLLLQSHTDHTHGQGGELRINKVFFFGGHLPINKKFRMKFK